MKTNPYLQHYLIEAQSLLVRLKNVKPFALIMPMVNAARVSLEAETEMQSTIDNGVRALNKSIRNFCLIITQNNLEAHQMQKMLSDLKIRFNDIMDQVDIFADVVSQRGDFKTGALIAGMDRLAFIGLKAKEHYTKTPIICFLERGMGAAIRRAKTPLPGGASNPVAIIQIPREKIPGFGIASSVLHEVGHQAAISYDFNDKTVELFHRLATETKDNTWALFATWANEILSDFWSVLKTGIGSTLGLMGVFCLPSHYIFRLTPKDPHPMPYLRVKISCAVGNRIYPHKQWNELMLTWEKTYPLSLTSNENRALIKQIETKIPDMIEHLVSIKHTRLGNKTLMDLKNNENAPENLRAMFRDFKSDKINLFNISPVTFFAVIGQAKYDKTISPLQEGEIINNALKKWSLVNYNDLKYTH